MSDPSRSSSTAPGVSRSIVIDAPPNRVWEAISTPGILELTHPFCRKNPVESWPGSDSKDRIVYYNGLVMVREFARWLDGIGYDLLIRPSGTSERSEVTWRVRPAQEGRARLTITLRPALRELKQRRADRLLSLLGRYLDSVLRGFDHYIRTGHPVRRNQFGAHRMFSPASSASRTSDGTPR